MLKRTARATPRSHAGVYCAVAGLRGSGMWCRSRTGQRDWFERPGDGVEGGWPTGSQASLWGWLVCAEQAMHRGCGPQAWSICVRPWHAGGTELLDTGASYTANR